MDETVVVTGANRGIGRAVADALAAEGLHVVLVCRDNVRGEAARRAIAARSPRARVTLIEGSLDTIAGIHRTADAIGAACPQLVTLVHNAGTWPTRRVCNEDGLEQAFVVNHLAPFLLNQRLTPALAAARGRVVQVTAGLYAAGRIDLDATPRGHDFHPLRTYATTKLCNLALLARYADHFRAHAVTIDAVHPGVIRTGLGDRAGLVGLLLRGVKRFWKHPDAGARPIVRLARDPALREGTGRYFVLTEPTPLLPCASDPAQSSALWEQARALTGT